MLHLRHLDHFTTLAAAAAAAAINTRCKNKEK